MRQPTRVLSLYEGFFAGGARIQHTSVVRHLDATTTQQHRVLSLTNRVTREHAVQAIHEDTSYRRLTRAGIGVRALDRTPADPLRVSHLAIIEQSVTDHDVILSLKEQPLTALTLVGTAGRPLVVSLHRSDPEHSGPALEVLARAYTSGILSAAVCCSHATRAAYHAATGIPLDLLPVIENGVDLHTFRPLPHLGDEMRRRLGIAPHAPVVLIAARFDEMKDIPLFVAAAKRFKLARPSAHFIACGAGMTAQNPALTSLLGHLSDIHLLGIQPQMQGLYNAADVVALTSAFGEAAPLCLLEAMATGTVAVTTDVGDAARIVGHRQLVTGHEAREVATAWERAYENRERHRGRLLRQRQRLNEQHSFDAYAALLDRLTGQTAVIPQRSARASGDS